MATIDDKVVAMSFENSRFEQGVNKSIGTLDRLRSALKFDGASKGLDELNRGAQNNQLGLIGRAIDAILPKLDTLRLVAIGVMSQIATRAVFAGAQLVKSFTLGPLISGFQEYETQLNAVQTILANTQAAGTNLGDVNAALDELNHYADQTIYNFSEMARNIGTFTAAGVDLDASTAAIKGIANLAALSGSNSQQASTAMYQLSQALSSGKVSLMDWNSVVNAGMGGTVFQRALAQTATKMGTLDEGAVKLTGKMKNVSIAGDSFRNSLAAAPGKESWLTSEVLTKTLSQFTGDLTDAELAAQGFNKAEIEAIQQQAKTAQDAATQVKTFTQLMETTKEAISSGWAQTWRLVFGDFNEAKQLFTGISEAVGGFVQASAHGRNAILKDWKKLGGRTALIKSFGNVFKALLDVLRPIRDAFHEIFPPVTGRILADLTKRFRDFTLTLRPSTDTIVNIKRTFMGLFAVLDIAKQIIGGVFGVFGRLFDQIFSGSGSFLELTARIGDWLVGVDEALKKGKGLENFFDGFGDVLEIPFKMIGRIKEALSTMFSGFSAGGFSGQMGGVSGILGTIGEAFGNLLESFSHTDRVVDNVLDGFVEFAERIGPLVVSAFENINFEAVLAVVRTGLLGGLVLMFKKFLGSGSLLQQLGLGGAGGGIVAKITGPFDALTGSLKAMQQQIQSKTLLNIAIAVGILAASIVALSMVDPEKLTGALGAMTVAFGELLGAMKILDQVMSTTSFIKMPLVAGSLILLAGALVILSAAVVILAQLSWEELLRGLTGVGVLLGIISAASIPLSKNSGGMVRAGIGITAIAVGLLILSNAVKNFAEMSWGEMAKGMIGVGIGLGILVGAMRLMPTGSMIAAGVGLIAVAVALKLLAGVVERFGGMDWMTMGKGMAGIAGALLILAGAMRLMPGNMIATAAGLLIVSFALDKIADVITSFGGMSIEEIAKGLGTLAGALIILAAALYAMSGTIAGAVALTIAAAGITVLTGALQTLGDMSWQEILTALIALAGAFAVIGVAGALITPVIPSLLGLGVALLLIGGGLALAGVGIALIGAGLSALIVAFPTGVGVLIAAFQQLTEGLINNVKLLVLGLLEIAEAFADTAPQFVDALIKILSSVLDGITKLLPKLMDLMETLLDSMLVFLHDNQSKIIQAGYDLLLALLRGLQRNIGDILDVAVDVIVKFLNGIARNMVRIQNAGVNIVLKFIRGIANNLGKIITAGGDIVVKFITGIGNYYGRIITAGATALSKFIKGIGDNAGKVVTAGVNSVIKFAEGLGKNAVRLANAAGQVILDFLNGLNTAVDTYAPQITQAALGVGGSIIAGIIQGMANEASDLYSAAEGIARSALSRMRDAILPGSPSRVTTPWGESISMGLAAGIKNKAPILNRSIDEVSEGTMRAMRQAMHGITDAINEIDANPTITPILDLTQVRSQTGELSKLTASTPITADISRRHASTVVPVTPDDKTLSALGGTTVHFEQNNNSPKALSEVEIYRQTRNQLSQLKTALAVT